jgi:hypothetical protein
MTAKLLVISAAAESWEKRLIESKPKPTDGGFQTVVLSNNCTMRLIVGFLNGARLNRQTTENSFKFHSILQVSFSHSLVSFATSKAFNMRSFTLFCTRRRRVKARIMMAPNVEHVKGAQRLTQLHSRISLDEASSIASTRLPTRLRSFDSTFAIFQEVCASEKCLIMDRGIIAFIADRSQSYATCMSMNNMQNANEMPRQCSAARRDRFQWKVLRLIERQN